MSAAYAPARSVGDLLRPIRMRHGDVAREPTLATMTGPELAGLPDVELVARCAAPTARRLHHVDPAVRAAGISELKLPASLRRMAERIRRRPAAYVATGG